MRAPSIVLAALLAGTVATTGCGADSSQDGQLSLVAAFYPMQQLAEQLSSDQPKRAVSVSTLVKPGVEPHDLELKPSQIATLVEADLLIYLKGFQPALDEAVAEHLDEPSRAFDVTTVRPLRDVSASHDGPAAHGGKDPHVWLDPDRQAVIANRLADKLGAIDPAHRADYTRQAKRLGAKLERLDQAYQKGLDDCERREIVVSHAAFGYLADKYDLKQIAVTGLSPEQEPTPRRLAEVIDTAREHKATVIFFETLVSPEVAKTLAREVGAQAKVLDPIEGLRPGSDQDYFSLMRTNLDNLRAALDCS
ncbi:MAG: metal ABC transporter substrate-binding protein [Micromonosporaceae bacterium]